jgi:hypothetical protein
MIREKIEAETQELFDEKVNEMRKDFELRYDQEL